MMATKNPDDKISYKSHRFLSVIVTYNRWDFLKKSFGALANQTYSNVEIAVIDNGSSYDVESKLRAEFPNSTNYSVIRFPVNIFDLERLWVQYKYVYNAWANIPNIDYVFIQSDDDFLANNFYELMNLLAVEYDSPGAMIGTPCDFYYETGLTIEPDKALMESVPVYSNGMNFFYATTFRRADNPLRNPGFSYIFRRDVILEAGGFGGGTSCFELHQDLSIIPYVDIAVHKEAKMYWARHGDQANKSLDSMCYSSVDDLNYLLDLIEDKWKINLEKFFVRDLKNHVEYLLFEENLKSLKCGFKTDNRRQILLALINLTRSSIFFRKLISYPFYVLARRVKSALSRA